jgi:hypothetical protein
MSASIGDISSRALAAYGVNQPASVKAATPSVMPENKGIGMPRISDTVDISDKAFDLLLTPGNYRPNVKAAPMEEQMTKTMISLTA